MITKIIMDAVTSFKKSTLLKTDKKINLIYGLNGTGKTTISNYLYNNDDNKFSKCSIEGLNGEDILVYNQNFIKEYFYESDNLKGIFTLSKENKKAEIKIKNANKEIEKYKKIIEELKTDKKNTHKELNLKEKKIENDVWNIRTNYTGGDRILEFCLDGLKSSKQNLLTYIIKTSKPDKKPDKTIDDIKKEVESIKGKNAQIYHNIPKIEFKGCIIENDSIFQKEVLGNEDTQVAKLIKKLNNSDWVKQGLNYLPENNIELPELCPFCQEKTITQHVLDNIKSYFDESYNEDLEKLKVRKLEY